MNTNLKRARIAVGCEVLIKNIIKLCGGVILKRCFFDKKFYTLFCLKKRRRKMDSTPILSQCHIKIRKVVAIKDNRLHIDLRPTYAKLMKVIKVGLCHD
jgi:hypothetical protein